MDAFDRFDVGCAAVHDVGVSEAIDAIIGFARARRGAVVVTPNIQHIAILETDAELRASYAAADLVLADGWPVVLAKQLAGGRNRARVTGADLLPAVAGRAGAEGLTVGVVGGRPGVAAAAIERVRASVPGLRCVLVAAPELSPDPDAAELDRFVATVNDAAPDVLFLGLGTPKQEVLVHRVRARLDVGVTLCIGAGIDFAAGAQRRAPSYLRAIGFEWAHRIAMDPRRLAARYVTSAPTFVRSAARSVRRQRAGTR